MQGNNNYVSEMTAYNEFEIALSAADAVLAKGCKEATRYLLTALNGALRCSMLSSSPIVELVAGTSGGLPRGDPRRRVLAAALSTFLKTTLAVVWNDVPLKQRDAVYAQLCQSVALRLMPALMTEVANDDKVIDLVSHLSTCIAMIVLIGPTDVTDAILDLSNGSSGTAVELSLASIGMLSDTRVPLGAVRRSLSRLSLQKNLDRFLLTGENDAYDGRRMILLLAEGMSFLSTSVAIDPQDVCPNLWEKLYASRCWTFALEQLLSAPSCSNAVDAVCGVLSCATDASDDGVRRLISDALMTARQASASRHDGLYILARVVGGCLEGCIADIVASDDTELCLMIEASLQTVGQFALEAFQQRRAEGDALLALLATNVMLLLGSLRPSGIPDMEPDDDPDDFEMTVEDLQRSNALKAYAMERVGSFLVWTCETLRDKICSATASEVRDIVQQWETSDASEWTTTAVDFDAPCVTVAVALERLLTCDRVASSSTRQPHTSLLHLALALSTLRMEEVVLTVQAWQSYSQQDIEAIPMLFGKATTTWGEEGKPYVTQMIEALTARCCDASLSGPRFLEAVLEAAQRYTSTTLDGPQIFQMCAAHWPLREVCMRHIRGLVLAGRATQPEALVRSLKMSVTDALTRAQLSVLLGRLQPEALSVAETVSLLTAALQDTPHLKSNCETSQEGTAMNDMIIDFAAALDSLGEPEKVGALPLVAQFCGEYMDVPRFMLLLAPLRSVDGEYVVRCCQTSVNALVVQQPLPVEDLLVFVEAPALVAGTVCGVQWYFAMIDWLLRRSEVLEMFDAFRWNVLRKCASGMSTMRRLIDANMCVCLEEVTAINSVLSSIQLAAQTIQEGDEESHESFEQCANMVGAYVYALVAKGLLAPVLQMCSGTLQQVVNLCCDDEFHLKQMLRKCLKEC